MAAELDIELLAKDPRPSPFLRRKTGFESIGRLRFFRLRQDPADNGQLLCGCCFVRKGQLKNFKRGPMKRTHDFLEFKIKRIIPFGESNQGSRPSFVIFRVPQAVLRRIIDELFNDLLYLPPMIPINSFRYALCPPFRSNRCLPSLSKIGKRPQFLYFKCYSGMHHIGYCFPRLLGKLDGKRERWGKDNLLHVLIHIKALLRIRHPI